MKEEKQTARRRRWPWIVAGLAAGLVAFVLLLPTILVSLRYPALSLDLSPWLPPSLGRLVDDKTLEVRYGLARGAEGNYVLHAHGKLLDWPFTARVNVTPQFRFLGVDAQGDASFRLDDTPWLLTADFTASSSGEWRANVNMDETAFDEKDPLLAPLLARLSLAAVSNLTFRGAVRLAATAERTAAVPVPKWTANARLADVAAACDANGVPVAIDGLRLGVAASGLANHVDIAPLHPRAARVAAAGFTLTNVYAHLYATETTMIATNRTASPATAAGTTNVTRTTFLVSEAGARCCGGDVRIYSLFLDPSRLNAGVTLLLDGIDAGEALKHLGGFRGEASGRLYGKLPLHLKGGRELRLRATYLYSVPGEVGRLRVYDPKPIVDNLAMGGVPPETCGNLSKALADLAYDVLKISLLPDKDGGLALTFKIAGSSTHGNVTVPVSLEVTFHGDLEQLVNTGFRTLNRK